MRVLLVLILSLFTLVERYSYERTKPIDWRGPWSFPNKYRLNNLKWQLDVDKPAPSGSWIRWKH